MKKIYDNYYVTEDGKVFNNFKQLSPCDNGKGYLILGLTYNKKRFIISVHRLGLIYLKIIIFNNVQRLENTTNYIYSFNDRVIKILWSHLIR